MIYKGAISGSEIESHKDNKYILFYTQWDARFVDNDDVVIKMGDTIGEVIGNTVEYYAGGPLIFLNSLPEVDNKIIISFIKDYKLTDVL